MRLKLVKQGEFLGTVCDFYTDEKSNIYMSRTQIGYALEYKSPSNAIKNIHNKYRERFDLFSVEISGAQFVPPINKNKNSPKIYMYTERGIYEVCRKSRQAIADRFYDWVYDTIDEIKRNGYYIVTEKDEKWLGIRRESKQVRKDETDQIKLFVEYARKQGSRNAERYFMIFTKLVNNKLEINSCQRDNLSQEALMEMKTLESLIRMRIRKLMRNDMPYKMIYQDVKNLIEEL